MGQQTERMDNGVRKACPYQIIKGVPVAVILDHVVQQRRTGGLLVVHLGGQIEGVEHIGIAAPVHILLVGVVHDGTGLFHKVGIIHRKMLLSFLRVNYCSRKRGNMQGSIGNGGGGERMLFTGARRHIIMRAMNTRRLTASSCACMSFRSGMRRSAF